MRLFATALLLAGIGTAAYGTPRDGATAQEIELDLGQGDGDEFPTLAEKARGKWLERAFYVNGLAAEKATPRVVRGLRFALGCRHPLVQAFALRGLAGIQAELLRPLGSEALFTGLVELLADNPGHYAQRTAQAVLNSLSGDTQERTPREWRRWWKQSGEELFRQALREPLPELTTARQERVDLTGLQTQTRELTTYFSQLRKRGLEIVFLMDVTLSMQDELERVRAQVSEITAFLELLLKGKSRLGFLTYGDRVVARQVLTKNLSQFVEATREIQVWNDPQDRTIEEGVSAALGTALEAENGLGWRRDTHKVLVLLGDAPPLDVAAAEELAAQAKEAGFVLNAIVTEPPAKFAHKKADKSFARLAELGGGMSVELSDPEELIARLLTLSFGGGHERDLRLFVEAYREVTREPEGD